VPDTHDLLEALVNGTHSRHGMSTDTLVTLWRSEIERIYVEWAARQPQAPASVAPDPRLKELAAWLAEKAAWYKVRAANSRSAHGVRETYRIDAERADAIATMLRGGS